MNDVALAVDMGGTNLRMAAISRDGVVLRLVRRETPRGVEPSDLIALFGQMADECREALDSGTQVIGIGVGVPANFTREGVLTHLTNVPTLNGMHLKRDLEAKFSMPATIENDATAAAIGENWLGASRDVQDSVMVTLGTGVGGGIIIDDKPLRGPDGTAGKIGHMCVEPEGPPCGCGSRGCIEQYASATAIKRMARENGLEAKNSFEVYQAAQAGDERARAVFHKMGTYLGITLAGLVNALNPEMIVIGGGAAAGWDAFIEHVRTEVHARAFHEPAERAAIFRSELGDNAGILGSARSAFIGEYPPLRK
jgi:glucokinase